MAVDEAGRDREALARASESVAAHFTRGMRATTSRYGVLTDPPVVSAVVGAILVLAIIVLQLDAVSEELLPLMVGLVATPVVVAVVTSQLLRGARSRVVHWLASLPFAVENVNGLLDGVGQNLVVRFEQSLPEREALNAMLEQVSEDSFALEYASEEPEVEVRIGVVDSKLNPTSSSFKRYQRVQALVARALIPLHESHPIAWVRVC